jgi:hypothetical protein
MVVKWVNRMVSEGGRGGGMYYAGIWSENNPLQLVSHRLCDAIVYDVKYLAEKVDGYELISVTKKELFEAKLKNV